MVGLRGCCGAVRRGVVAPRARGVRVVCEQVVCCLLPDNLLVSYPVAAKPVFPCGDVWFRVREHSVAEHRVRSHPAVSQQVLCCLLLCSLGLRFLVFRPQALGRPVLRPQVLGRQVLSSQTLRLLVLCRQSLRLQALCHPAGRHLASDRQVVSAEAVFDQVANHLIENHLVEKRPAQKRPAQKRPARKPQVDRSLSEDERSAISPSWTLPDHRGAPASSASASSASVRASVSRPLADAAASAATVPVLRGPRMPAPGIAASRARV